MSDREAFEKWARDNGIRYQSKYSTGEYYFGDADLAWKAWQAAQAQAGDGEAVGKVYYTGRGFLDVDWFTSDIPDDALLYAAPPAAVNQQLLEALKTFVECWSDDSGFSNPYPEDVIKAKAAIAAAQEVGNE